MIRFGPAGLGGVKEAISNLERYHKLGLKACEIAFVYGAYIKEKEAIEIGNAAKRLDIKLSIHAPYWINLNSEDKEKVEKSKERILECCKIGELLGAYLVTFHPGYYGKIKKEESYNNIKRQVEGIRNEIQKHNWGINIAAETTGKVNVFGTIEEILRLVKETGCWFTIDFAHLLARSNGTMHYREMYEQVKQFDKLHCHFSGIIYSSKGERSHKLTPDAELKKLIDILPKNKEIVIINESPDPVGDSVKALRILNNS